MSRAYRFLLLLYPRDFRLRFAEPMMEAFVDWREDARHQGRLSVTAFYLRTLLTTAFLALLVPAIRASRIAPMTALKQE